MLVRIEYYKKLFTVTHCRVADITNLWCVSLNIFIFKLRHCTPVSTSLLSIPSNNMLRAWRNSVHPKRLPSCKLTNTALLGVRTLQISVPYALNTSSACPPYSSFVTALTIRTNELTTISVN